MRVLVCLLMAVATLFSSLVHAQATGSAYAVDYDRLYRIDLSNRNATLIGTLGSLGPQSPMADLSGLTTTADGRMLVASDTLKALLQVDPNTGEGTLVGYFGIPQVNQGEPLDFAMTAGCDGQLWLASPVADKLWRVDPATASVTLVGSLGSNITGLVMDHGELFGIGGRGDEGWYAIDTQSGQSTFIGSLGSEIDYITSASPAISADDEVLAVLNYVPPQQGIVPPEWSDLARINRDSGEASLLGEVTGPSSLSGIGIRGFTVGTPSCQVVAPPIQPPASGAVGAPTLGEWSTIALLLALMGLGARAARKPSGNHS